MAIIPTDLRLARTPVIDAAGFFIDPWISILPAGPALTQILRKAHLSYVLRDLALIWFYDPKQIGKALTQGKVPESYKYIRQFKNEAEQGGLSHTVVLLPYSLWGFVPYQLTRDGIQYVDLSFVRNEFTDADYMATRFDPHPSAAVHRRIAEELAEYFLRGRLKQSSSETQ
jgi:hypothetical protein